MAITSFEQKQNRKEFVPIRPGNRGGWSDFNWEDVRNMPYHDREMYLGNSVKIGILDKTTKWRKKDWYTKNKEKMTEQERMCQFREAQKKDMERMNNKLGNYQEQKQEALTPEEMQLMLKKIKAKKQGENPIGSNSIGIGFDKTKIQIRAVPKIQSDNLHRLQGNFNVKNQKQDFTARHFQQQHKEKQKKGHERSNKHRKQSRQRSRSYDKKRRPSNKNNY